MDFDELEWVRNIIDAWLTEHATDVALGLSLIIAVASWIGTH